MSRRPKAKESPPPGEQPPQKGKLAPKPREAWNPAPWENEEAAAIQALIRGEANPGQQRIAMKWILDGASNLYDLSYRPGAEGDRDTAFAEGRRFVGMQIVKLSRLNLELFRKV